MSKENKDNIRKYILTNKDSYSKEAIINELLRSGRDREEVNEVIEQVYNLSDNLNSNTKKGNYKWLIIVIVTIVLLVVSIPIIIFLVGVFMFSQVDFESLQPQMLELSNNLRADIENSIALSSSQQIVISFYYYGDRMIEMHHNSTESFETQVSTITIFDEKSYEEVSQCYAIEVKNIDTQMDSLTTQPITIIAGQRVEVRFQCELNKFSSDDLIIGNVRIFFLNSRTGILSTSNGNIRIRSN
ncbi:MAG: hypothetical protein ACMXYB_01490 [Candidatus Woesearchaeota archaeon]